MQPEVIGNKKASHLSSASGTPAAAAATGFEAVKEGAADAFESGRKALSNVIDSVPESAKNVYHDVEGAVDGFFKSTAKQIRSNPIQSLFIGLGVGAVIGLLLRGRSAN